MNFIAATMQLPLHDIVDDHSVSWWPLAIGWWLALAILAVATTALILWGRRRAQQRRLAHTIESLLQAPAKSMSEINLRLKQVLLLKYTRAQLANLDAQAWQQRLTAELPDQQQAAFSEQLAPYLELQYQPQTQSTVAAYQGVALDWWAQVRPGFIKGQHHV